MRLRTWFAPRGLGFVARRGALLLGRYGLSPAGAEERIERLVARLAKDGGLPTLFVPARVAQRYPRFLHGLMNAGAEIGVHGYEHVALGTYPPAVAIAQLVRAVRAFERLGIRVRGFRCPYVSSNEEILNSLPKGLFEYGSNKTICCYDGPLGTESDQTRIYATLDKMYHSATAHGAIPVPYTRASMLEIPVCVPDDLQLHDGLGLNPEGIADAWARLLRQMHGRGELFTLIFHTELCSDSESSFTALLKEAKSLQPPVWVARLQDICEWWEEKNAARIEAHDSTGGMHLSFACSERATILVRGLDCPGQIAWDGPYSRLSARYLQVPPGIRPFVGLPASAPPQVLSFLREQGYFLDTSETAASCSVYMDAATLERLASQAQLIDHIEATRGPLVRYWRWPNGAKSALSLTGDLDALTLWDYGLRLFTS